MASKFLFHRIFEELLLFLCFYLYLNKKQSTAQPAAQSQAPAQDSSSVANLEKDASSVDVTSPDAEFKSVDTDLQSL